jgi:hypothetical protein
LLNASKDYYKKRGYDAIQGKHIDSNKEAAYHVNAAEKRKFQDKHTYDSIPEGVKG